MASTHWSISIPVDIQHVEVQNRNNKTKKQSCGIQENMEQENVQTNW